MVDPTIGQIIMFAGNFAPSGWMLCNGQLLSIADNTALYALIGTTYGGDGQTTFALPDLRGCLPVHQGTGPGLSTVFMGEVAGVEQVTLTSNQLPSHIHSLVSLSATNAAPLGNATHVSPAGKSLATGQTKAYSTTAPSAPLNAASLTATGGNQAHDNMMPYLCVNFIIALIGIFPSRN